MEEVAFSQGKPLHDYLLKKIRLKKTKWWRQRFYSLPMKVEGFSGGASKRLFAKKDDPKKDKVVEMKTLQHTNGLLALI